MKKFLREFKAFAMRGNVIDLAVGVVIGGAFSSITTSLVHQPPLPEEGGGPSPAPRPLQGGAAAHGDP